VFGYPDETLSPVVDELPQQSLLDFSLGGFLGDIIGFFAQLLYS